MILCARDFVRLALFTSQRRTSLQLPTLNSIVEQMRQSGLAPDTVSLNTIMSGMIRAGDLDAAKKLLGSMDKNGPPPDQTTFATLINGCSLAGDLEAANTFFQRSRRGCARGDLARDTVVLNAFLKACVQNGNIKTALDCLQEIVAATEEARLQLARHHESVEGGGNSDGRIPAAAATAAAVLRSVGAPDVISYSTLIRALSTSPNPNAGKRAIALYREMRQTFTIKPDRKLVDAILVSVVNTEEKRPFILGLGKLGQYEFLVTLPASLQRSLIITRRPQSLHPTLIKANRRKRSVSRKCWKTCVLWGGKRRRLRQLLRPCVQLWRRHRESEPWQPKSKSVARGMPGG